VSSGLDCWTGGYTPELCCLTPGRGQQSCWDGIFTFQACCSETAEGRAFAERRQAFVQSMIQEGAEAFFEIGNVPGAAGRMGAVATAARKAQDTILRMPRPVVYSLSSVPPAITAAAKAHGQGCDPQAALALGLLTERANPSSRIGGWLDLLPKKFHNVLWFNEDQVRVVNSTFFDYIIETWFEDLRCMQRVIEISPDWLWRGPPPSYDELRWALSVVKTRGFSTTNTREGTLLIPLADFLNHDWKPNVHTSPSDPFHFIAREDIRQDAELTIEYAQASNLEFLVRYGFRIEGNPYGGRPFELTGEPLQQHCSPIVLRHDIAQVVEDQIIDCHRQARQLSFKQQFGELTPDEALREDRYIYKAILQACSQLHEMLQVPPAVDPRDTMAVLLMREVKTERALLNKCGQVFDERLNKPGP